MKLEVITEKEHSPFRHIFPENFTNGRRYCYHPKQIGLVMTEFLDSLGLKNQIRSLEIGAGREQAPSKALVELGADAKTLDIDCHGYFTKITAEELVKLGENRLYPSAVGNGQNSHYLGDVAFIGHERSELKNKKFDIVFYWGSIHGTGFNSSIEDSLVARSFGIEIPLRDRLMASVLNVDEVGYMAYISGFFNRICDPATYLENIVYFNGRMIDTLAVWANHERKPKRAIIYGLTKGFAFEYLRENAHKECSLYAFKYAKRNGHLTYNTNGKPTEAELKESVDGSRLSRLVGTLCSLSSRKSNEASIKKLGVIDAIVVNY